MILVGIALLVVSILDAKLPGALRFLLGAGGIVICGIGFCLALNVSIKLKASADGGVEGAADVPRGYTRKIRISDQLVGGDAPPKVGTPPPRAGTMPPKEGRMPAKTVEDAMRLPPARPAEETAQDRPRSSAEP